MYSQTNQVKFVEDLTQCRPYHFNKFKGLSSTIFPWSILGNLVPSIISMSLIMTLKTFFQSGVILKLPFCPNHRSWCPGSKTKMVLNKNSTDNMLLNILLTNNIYTHVYFQFKIYCTKKKYKTKNE